MTEDLGEWAWEEEDPGSLKRIVKNFKEILIETFKEYFACGLYSLDCHPHDHMVEDIRNFRTVSVLDRSPYGHFSVQVKQVYGNTLQRRQEVMMETVGVMERSYERARSYGKKENGGELR